MGVGGNKMGGFSVLVAGGAWLLIWCCGQQEPRHLAVAGTTLWLSMGKRNGLQTWN